MTLKDEATAFRLLQEGSKANAAERYVSELAAGVKETIAIENLLNQNGFTVKEVVQNTLSKLQILLKKFTENMALKILKTQFV